MIVCKKCGAEYYGTAPGSCLLCGAPLQGRPPRDPKFDTHAGPDPRFDTHIDEADENGITEYDRQSNYGCW